MRGGSGDWCVLWVHVDALVRHFAGPFIIGLLADLCFGVAVPVHTKDQCMDIPTCVYRTHIYNIYISHIYIIYIYIFI